MRLNIIIGGFVSFSLLGGMLTAAFLERSHTQSSALPFINQGLKFSKPHKSLVLDMYFFKQPSEDSLYLVQLPISLKQDLSLSFRAQVNWQLPEHYELVTGPGATSWSPNEAYPSIMVKYTGKAPADESYPILVHIEGYDETEEKWIRESFAGRPTPQSQLAGSSLPANTPSPATSGNSAYFKTFSDSQEPSAKSDRFQRSPASNQERPKIVF